MAGTGRAARVILAGQCGSWAATRPFRTIRNLHTRTDIIITIIIIPHRTAGTIIRTEGLTRAVDIMVAADLMVAAAVADTTRLAAAR